MRRAVWLSLYVVVHFAVAVGALPQTTPRCEIYSAIEGWTQNVPYGREYYVEVEHNNVGSLKFYWRNDSWTNLGPVNPYRYPLNKQCLLTSSLLTIEASGYCGETTTHTVSVAAPDLQPTLALQKPSPLDDPYGFRVDWSAPDSGNRVLRLLIPATGQVAFEERLGGPVSDTKMLSATLPAVVKLQSCDVLYAEEPISVTQDHCHKECDGECPEMAQCVGAPVNTVSGSVHYEESDPLPVVSFLPFQRTYLGGTDRSGWFGSRWFSMFDATLDFMVDVDGAQYVSVVTEEGVELLFRGRDGNFVQMGRGGSRRGRLRRESDGTWTHTDGNQRLVRRFDSGGFPIAFREVATGREVVLTWANGAPAQIDDSWGNWRLDITADTANRRVTSIALSGQTGAVWTYGYGDGHLITVDSPVGRWRTYDYFNFMLAPSAWRLRVVRDGAGNEIERHDYDINRPSRTLNSFGPGGEIDAIEVQQSGRIPSEYLATVRYRNGRQELHYRRWVAGAWRTVEIVGACVSCGNRTSAVVYDDHGHAIRAQSADGYITETTYDDAGQNVVEIRTNLRPDGCEPATAADSCRKTTDALATVALVATTATAETTLEYTDPQWPYSVTRSTTASVLQATGVRTERTTYDGATGQALTRSVSGWTGSPAREETRTTSTALYNGTEGASFTPGGAFATAWLTLPQPRLRKSIDGPRTDVADRTRFVYYPIHSSVPAVLRGRLAATQNALGHVVRFEDYDAFGNAGAVVDPNGVVQRSTYDAIGRLVTSTWKGVPQCDKTADPLCDGDATSTRTYTGAGPLTSEMRPGGGVTSYEYDSRGRPSAIERGPSASDRRERLEYAYDPSTARKESERLLAREGTAWVEKRRTSFTYDASEQLARVTHPGGASVAYTYDRSGRISTVRDENHAMPNTSYTYDAGGRLTKVQQTLSSASGGKVTTSYAYDLHGNLTSVTDPNGNVTTYEYDDFGQMLTQTSPVSGTTRYAYDAAGNVTRTTDANGAVTDRTYDALNRVAESVSKRKGHPTEIVRSTYDSGTFGKGRLAGTTDPAGTTQFTYDRAGRLLSEARNLAGTTFTTRYEYDLDGNRTAIRYPSGRKAVYGFDFAGRQTTLDFDGAPIVTEAAYAPYGPLTKLSFANQTTRTMTYDARYRPDTNVLANAAGTVASYTYGHDDAGNITSIQDMLDPAYDRTFVYDDLHRLTGATTGSALWGTASYAYDAMGNMLSRTRGSRTDTFVYSGATPKLSSVTEDGVTRTVSHDPAGNETAAGGSAFVYSSRNALLAQAAQTYVYDARSVRTSVLCAPSVLSPVQAQAGAGAMNGSFSVDADAECAWTAISSVPWISITGGASGSGTGTVGYAVLPNPTTVERRGTIQVKGRLYTVTQAGASTAAPFRSDFDGDGVADALIRDHDSGELKLVLMRDTSSVTVSIGKLPRRSSVVAVGDFWGDGRVSFAVMNRDNREVTLWRMDGEEVLSRSLVRAVGPGQWNVVAAGDFNGDRKSDLLFRRDSARQLAIWLLDGNAVLSDPVLSPTLSDSRWQVVGVADFGGDGKSDILFRHGATGELALWHMNGTTPTSTAVLGEALPSLTSRIDDVSDFDGDGKADILVREVASGELRVWRMDGSTILSKTAVGTLPDRRLRIVAFENLTADDRGDLLLRDSATGNLQVWRSDGATLTTRTAVTIDVGTLRRWSVEAPPRARARAARPDYGGDGHADLLLRHATTNDMLMWQMNGRAVLESGPIGLIPSSDWKASRLGDAGGNRLTDVLWRNTVTNELALWQMVGVSVTNSSVLGTLSASMQVVGMGDLNGDENAEVLLRNSASGELSTAGLLNHQLGAATVIATIGAAWQLVAVGDFNGDGTDDLVLRNSETQDIDLWEMNGPTVLARGVIGRVSPAAWRVQSAGDFNGDGMADLLFRLDAPPLMAMWEMNGRTVIANEVFRQVSHNDWRTQAAADYNGDGQTDIVFRYGPSDAVAMWEMNGRQVVDDRVFGQVASPLQEFQPTLEESGATSASARHADGLLSMSVTIPWWTPAAAHVPTWLPPQLPANVPTFVAVANGASTSVPTTATPTWLPPAGGRATAPATSAAAAEPAAAHDLAGAIETLAATDARHFLYTPELSLMAEIDSTAVAYEYLWFAGQPAAQHETATGALNYYFNDHLGTPILTTNASGVVNWRVEREPYGAIHTTRTGTDRHQPLAFPGQEEHAGSELAYNVFRWYRAGWGRYTQSDPLGLHGGTNVYHYTYSNPIRWTDPRGLKVHPMDILNCAQNPIDCLQIQSCKTKAEWATIAKYGSMQDDTESNAFQHCYWNCCMAKVIGATEAKKFGDAHEEFKNNTQCKKTMDLFNNGVGQTVGAGKDCDTHCGSTPLMKTPPPGCKDDKCGTSENPNYKGKPAPPGWKQPHEW